jgi:hypothetical protein
VTSRPIRVRTCPTVGTTLTRLGVFGRLPQSRSWLPGGTMFRKALATVAVVATSFGAVLALTAAPAGASASNCPARPAFWDGTVGNYCAIVYGTGMHVSEVYGTFTNLVRPVCNWTITAEFFDSSYKWVRTYNSPKHTGCTRHSSTAIYPNYTLGGKSGHICSTLKDNGNRLTSYCFGMHT